MGKKRFEDGQAEEARKVPSNKQYHEFVKQLQNNKEEMDTLRSDRKGIFDRARNEGISAVALKIAFKEYVKPVSDDDRLEVNRILASSGRAPLFSHAEVDSAAA